MLSWGYGKVNKKFARESLLKNTLCAHSEVYPHIWFGIWSGPDSYNAHYAKNAGETFYHITPMTDFPIMNANAHSNPLTTALKLCGIEPTINGFNIEPLLPDEEFEIETLVLSLKKKQNNLYFSYQPLFNNLNNISLQFKVNTEIFKSKQIKVYSKCKKISFHKTDESNIVFSLDFNDKNKIEWEIKIQN